MACRSGTRAAAGFAAAALLGVVVGAPAVPGPATPRWHLAADGLAPEPDLGQVRAELDAAARSASSAAATAQRAAYASVQARIARQDAASAVDAARSRLAADVRGALIGDPVAELPSWVFADPGDDGLLTELRERQVTHRQDEVAQLRAALARLDALQAGAEASRARAAAQAGDAALAEDRAQRLLEAAQRVHAANQKILAELAAKKQALDELNRRLVAAVAPAMQPDAPVSSSQVATEPAPDPATPDPVTTNPDGTRPDASAAAQARVLAVLESSSPDALPPGYRPTGQVLTGDASWYGPGFIGSPTSSGVPYDPERLTCAMLAVPLGSVVRVVRPNGRSVNLMVTDHGPYAAGRILDVSMRANRILDLGAGRVTISVLERTG